MKRIKKENDFIRFDYESFIHVIEHKIKIVFKNCTK